MRPRLLQLEGFTCFREPQTVELGELQLFAISGPTGAGKSSLLDAMIYALYGEVPRVGKRGLSELIALGARRMAVRLDFEVGQQAYRVARVTRRSGGGPVQLERLEGERALPLAEGARKVTPAVTELLGLGAEAFLQSVVLPQGEFARFLKSTATERSAILNQLLRLQVYERMCAEAGRRERALRVEVQQHETRLREDYADATDEQLAATRQELEQLGRELAPLQAAAEAAARARDDLQQQLALWGELAQLEQELAQLGREADAMQTLARQVEAAERSAPIWPRVEAARAEQQRLTQLQQRLVQAREQAAEQRREAEQAAEQLAQVRGEQAHRRPRLAEQLAQLDRALGLLEPRRLARRRLTQARAAAERLAQELGQLEQELSRNGDRLAELSQLAEQAQQAAETGERRLRQQERAHQALVLRHGLQPGEPCPVCGQPVDELPTRGAQHDAQSTERAAQQARRELEQQERRQRQRRETLAQRQRDAAQLRTELQVARARLDPLRRALQREQQSAAAAGEELERLEQQLQAATGGEEPESQRRQVEQRLEALEQRVASAREGQQSRARESAQASRAVQELTERAAELSARQAELSARALDEARAAGFETLQQVAQARLAEGQLQQQRGRVDHWRQQRARQADRAQRLRQSLGPEQPAARQLQQAERQLRSASAAYRAAVERSGELRAREASLVQRLQRARELRQQLERQRVSQGRYHQLALDLRSDRFQAHLLQETLQELVQGASQRLIQFSDRYTLAFRGNDFVVVDHDNARETRSADTLSGGETFLVSLALALELSEQVQRAAGAVRLDSLFVDEGFGTLDPETLDVVAGAVETLGAEDRMVGIITHVAELTRRMPARIEVSRGAGGGARAEVVLP